MRIVKRKRVDQNLFGRVAVKKPVLSKKKKKASYKQMRKFMYT